MYFCNEFGVILSSFVYILSHNTFKCSPKHLLYGMLVHKFICQDCEIDLCKYVYVGSEYLYVLLLKLILQSLITPWIHKNNPVDFLQVNENIQKFKVQL